MRDIWITQHAKERFWKRHVPHLSFAQASSLLYDVARTASPLKERTNAGEQLFQAENPRCVLCVKRDKGAAHTLVVVTVLPLSPAQRLAEENAKLEADDEPRPAQVQPAETQTATDPAVFPGLGEVWTAPDGLSFRVIGRDRKHVVIQDLVTGRCQQRRIARFTREWKRRENRPVDASDEQLQAG